MVTAIAVDPIPQGLFVHPDFPGGRRNRLGFLDHHPSDLFLVFRSERPALVRHGHPLFRERNLGGFPVRKIPGPSIFIWSLTIRWGCSQGLLVNGTVKSTVNRQT